MNEIRLQTDYDAYYPGTDLVATVTWHFSEPPTGFLFRLLWTTEGKGTQDVGQVSTKRISTTKSQGSEDVKIRLPWGPYSYSGKLLSILWSIEVTAEPGGETASFPFIMGPDAKEVLMGTSKAGSSTLHDNDNSSSESA